MKKTLILAAMAVVLAGGLFGGESSFSDAQVRRALNLIYDCFEGPHRSAVNALFAQDMNYDTNQFVRVAKEMAEADEYIAPMLTIISKYDIQQGIPYLYGYATNENNKVAFTACHLILEREGLTSNSVAAVETFLSTTNASREAAYYRCELCRDALHQVSGESATEDLRLRVMRSALSYALRDGSHVAPVDGYIMAFDPAYQYSSNRLEVLRSSLEWNINDYQRNYVTNAIHEIEAQLPPE